MVPTKFKTNINCNGCLAKVKPGLNQLLGEDNWEIDLKTPDKTLIVLPEDEAVSKEEIIGAVNKAGFTAEAI